LILGARTDSGSVASGWAITPTLPPTLVKLPSALSSPREGHSATLVGNDVLVCGGSTGTQLSATCDLIDGTNYTIKQMLPLNAARRDHVAQALETGPVLIAGGLGSDGMPLSTVELYTPAE
jgi:hypothetical protein